MADEAEKPEILLCKLCSSSSKIDLSSEKLAELKRSLPTGYVYCLCELCTEDGELHQASLKLKLTTEKEAKNWLKQYQILSRTTWRTRCTHPNTGRKLLCRLERICHHNTRVRANSLQTRRTKNTGCPANLNIRVKKLAFTRRDGGQTRKCRSADPHFPEWPTSLSFVGSHNHPIDDPSVLSHRDVSHSVKMKFIQLFQDGHSVTEALKIHKDDLLLDHGEEYDKIVSDRHFCPDAQFCYRLYYDIFRKDTKTLSKKKVQRLLEERIAKYNDENGICICRRTVDGEDVVAIVTPLMKRVHSMLPSAGQAVFTDSFCSSPGHPQLLVLLTDSIAGGLPLGCFITGSDSCLAVESGLEMIHKVVGVGSFHGRGRNGPRLFLTSNSEKERLAIINAYPSAKQVLCIFHILQSFWQYLFGAQCEVAEADKPYIFNQMKILGFCSSEKELKAKYEDLMVDLVVLKYDNIVSHFRDIYGHCTYWALFHLDLDDLDSLGDFSNNFCNAAMKVLKDRPFEKLKSANTFQLLDLVISRVNGLCKSRLEDLAEGKWQKVLACRYGYIQCLSAFNREEIIEESPLIFTMPLKKKSSQQRVRIDMNMGFCSCAPGLSGGPCKHQYVLIRYFDIQQWKFQPVADTATKQRLMTIAQGDTLNDLDQLFTRLKEALQRDQEMFAKPLERFIFKWTRHETDIELVDAMQTFTKAKSDPLTKRKSCEAPPPWEGDVQKRAKVDGIVEGDSGAPMSTDAAEHAAQGTGSLLSTLQSSPVQQSTPLPNKTNSSSPSQELTASSGVVRGVESAAEVIRSRAQSNVPAIENVTSGPRIVLSATSGKQEAFSELAGMAEQSRKIMKETFTVGAPSSEASSPPEIYLGMDIGESAYEGGELIIVDLVSLR